MNSVICFERVVALAVGVRSMDCSFTWGGDPGCRPPDPRAAGFCAADLSRCLGSVSLLAPAPSEEPEGPGDDAQLDLVGAFPDPGLGGVAVETRHLHLLHVAGAPMKQERLAGDAPRRPARQT